MTALETTRIGLPTGVTLKLQMGGPDEAEPIIFLHGFPESHRSWRLVLPNLAQDFRVYAPDQRGYAGSDKPEGVDAYKVQCIVDDLIALADALGIGRFTLIGHDWGGAAAWAAALKHPERVARLVIVNAPHPLIFQRSVIEDEEQRAASQYIRALRNPGMEKGVKAIGLGTFFDNVFGAHADLRKLSDRERQAYLDEWSEPGALTAMLNWYRAADIVVPEVGEKAKLPLWTYMPFPHVKMPTLVLWGMKDKALLPIQLEGLDDVVDDLRVVKEPDAGHFITWEKPEAVSAAIRAFIADKPLQLH